MLALASQGPQGRARAVFEFGGARRYEYRMEVSQDGQQWSPFVRGTYTRGE